MLPSVVPGLRMTQSVDTQPSIRANPSILAVMITRIYFDDLRALAAQRARAGSHHGIRVESVKKNNAFAMSLAEVNVLHELSGKTYKGSTRNHSSPALKYTRYS